jgi:phosphoglycolate phosphatase
MRYQGIMFDMDNTILKSNINFAKMKQACEQILIANNVHKWTNLDELSSTSQLIEIGKEYERSFGDHNKIVEQMLAATTVCETEGMKGAILEEGAAQVIKSLSKGKTLVIVTNNATKAAKIALRDTGVHLFFDQVFGRDCLPALKPSPEAVKAVLQKYPGISPVNWVMVGDSWIDGKSAHGAGIDFIGYRCSEEELKKHQVLPTKLISKLDEIV